RQVQQRILHSAGKMPFVFRATDAAKTFLLWTGTDMRYGARHLKRTIERLLVHPMCNLIASNQVNAGDYIEVDFDDEERKLSFATLDHGLSLRTMMNLIEDGMLVQATAAQAA